MKVYELAKDLNLKSVELLDRLRKEHNMPVKNHMQSLSKEDVEKIRQFFEIKSKASPSPTVRKKSTLIRKRSVPSKKTVAVPKEDPPQEEKPVLRTGIIRRRVKEEKKSKKTAVEKNQDQAVEPKTEPAKDTVPGSTLTHRGIRPGLVTSEGQTDILKKINETIDVSEIEKKKQKKTGLEKEGQNQQFRATDFRKREIIFQPKKKRLTAGLVSKKTQITTPKSHKRLIKMYDNNISIEDISHQMRIKKQALIQKIKTDKLFSDSKIPSHFDYETATLVSSLFNFEVKNMVKDKGEVIESLFFGDLAAEKQSKPPVVTVMGHVDHGKTTLLDYIRKSRIASKEAGGITQHIGAYSVPVGDSFVTFIDTPGHAAFTSMRARGAKVTDIVVIVVAADDGIQPQTIEAINHAKEAKVPIIIAINKTDLPAANIDQTKKQITEHGLVPEEWGGDTFFCSISALKGDGIKGLLEHVLLLAEVNELKANPKRSAVGVVIESRLEKGRGWVMTLLVQDGTLESGQILIAENQVGRARQMTNDVGRTVSSAGPGMAVEISGFNQAIQVGEAFYVVKNEKEARRLISEQKSEEKEEKSTLSMEDLLLKIHKNKTKTLNIILKTDVIGSMEAVKYSIEKLNTEEVEAKIIHANLGAANESDALLASTASAILICFNVGVDSKAQKLLQKDAVTVKSYTVIYDLLKEVELMMANLLDPEIQETSGGKAEIQQVFPISNVGVIAGCKVLKGKIAGNHMARLIRDTEVIYKGKISSLKRFKQSAKEVVEGQECGIGLFEHKDLKAGDIIETFTQVEIRKETL